MIRKKTIIGVFLFLNFLCLLTLTSVAQEFKDKPLRVNPAGVEFVQTEIVVKFKTGVPDFVVERLNNLHGASVLYTSPFAGFKRLRIPSTKTVAEMVEIYQKNPNVAYAEPNAICYAFNVPNDPLYQPYQWHFYNAEYGGIHMETAWDVQPGGSSDVIIGILDSGVAYENYERKYLLAPDLAGTNFVPGYDFINNDSHPNDDEGHGTHVAGTVAQTTNNDLGVAGIAYNSSIMPVKVLNARGSGTATALADGLYFAADNGADVINMSLGWPPGYDPGATVRDAVQYAYNRGVTIIAASGNDGSSEVGYPAAYDEFVIAVGATRYDEQVASYSNTGTSLDLTAPGGDLDVDQNNDGYGDGVLQQTFGRKPGDFGYYFYTGTSMASPHVAGVAALVIANGVTGPDAVRSVLQSTAEDHGDPDWDPIYGHGIVDAAAALNATPPQPQNHAPVADAGGPYAVTVNTPLTFDGSGSGDQDGDLLTYAWDFGDGNSGTGVAPVHTYTSTGTFNVSLVVNDGELDSDPASTTVTVTNPQSGQEMRVVSIAMSTVTSTRGKNVFTSATAGVTVLDNSNAPLPGATVTGQWSGLTTDVDVFATDENGLGTAESDKVKSASGTFTFTIESVVLDGYSWDVANSMLSNFITVSGANAASIVGTSLTAFPNPANPSTTVAFTIDEPGQVTLDVYNTMGQRVRTLLQEYKNSGQHRINWDGRNEQGNVLVSGIYFLRLQTASQNVSEKFLLVR